MRFSPFVPVFVLAAAALPAHAANKDIERLYVQIAALQGQLADLQRSSEESLREIRRLNESLAEQNANLQKGLADQRVQGEAIQATVRELTERMSELGERIDGMRATPRPPRRRSTRPAARRRPAHRSRAASRPLPGTPGVPPPRRRGVRAPPPRELYSQAYADYARGNYDLAIQEYTEYLQHYPRHGLLGQRAVLDRRVPVLEAAIRAKRSRPGTSCCAAYPSQRQAAGRAAARRAWRCEKLGAASARRSPSIRFVVERYPNSEAGTQGAGEAQP